MRWYEYEICVPFNNPDYDAALGGSHDLDVATPPNTPITALLSGTVSSSSAPSWGKQLGIKLDTPYRGIEFMAYLHLAAVNVFPVGSRISANQVIGWSGGCNTPEQYAGTSNPTGQNFCNPPSQSSRPQTGIALMRGPEYGVGAGWTTAPDPALDPTPLLEAARAGVNVATVPFTDREKQLWGRLENVPLNESFAIPQSWVAALRRTHYFGPPVEPEVDGTQAFSCAYAKWDPKTGIVHWFTQQGEYHF